MGLSERQKRIVASAYRREVSKLQSYMPASYVSLREALSSPRPGVPLNDGTFHEFDPEHLRLASEAIPRILWSLVNLPIVLYYEKDADGRRRFLVAGDAWQRRAVEMLLTGRLAADGRSELDSEEAYRLLSRYRSLFFVSLRL